MFFLPQIEFLIGVEEALKKKFLDNPSDIVIELDLKDNQRLLENEINTIKFQVTISADVLKPHHVEEMRFLIEILEEYFKFDLDFDAKSNVAGIIANIKSILLNWPNPRV